MLINLQLTLVAIGKKHLDVEDFFYHVMNVAVESFKHRDLLYHHQAEKLKQLLEFGKVHIGQPLYQDRGLQKQGDTCWGLHFR